MWTMQHIIKKKHTYNTILEIKSLSGIKCDQKTIGKKSGQLKIKNWTHKVFMFFYVFIKWFLNMLYLAIFFLQISF